MLLPLSSSTSSSSLTSTSSTLLFECFFLYLFFAALPLLPCSTATTFVWRNTFVNILLLHAGIINIIAEWFITISATATTYSTIISMIVIRIRVLMQFMLKRNKILWIKYNWKISFIQACKFINLTRMHDLSKFCFKFGTHTKKAYKTDFKITWQLANVDLLS